MGQRSSIYILLVSVFLLFGGCLNRTESKNGESKIDLGDPVKLGHQLRSLDEIDSLAKVARPDLGIQNLKFVGDTLRFLSSSFFFYYPFGKFSDIQSLLKKYPMLKMEVVSDTGSSENLYRTSFKGSFIKFVVNDDTERIEIVYGKIQDENIVFTNGFKVGLGRDEFLSKLFNGPVNLKGIKNIKIISALDGIFHNYHFENEKITTMEMDTDYLYSKF